MGPESLNLLLKTPLDAWWSELFYEQGPGLVTHELSTPLCCHWVAHCSYMTTVLGSDPAVLLHISSLTVTQLHIWYIVLYVIVLLPLFDGDHIVWCKNKKQTAAGVTNKWRSVGVSTPDNNGTYVATRVGAKRGSKIPRDNCGPNEQLTQRCSGLGSISIGRLPTISIYTAKREKSRCYRRISRVSVGSNSI